MALWIFRRGSFGNARLIRSLALGALVFLGPQFGMAAPWCSDSRECDPLCPNCACGEHEEEEYEEPCALTMGNLLAGWNQEFVERSHEGRALRGRLFRTKKGFLEHEFRADYAFVSGADDGLVDEHELEVELDLPFNRRFMMELEAETEWEDAGNDVEFTSHYNIVSVFQLVDTYATALNLQFNVAPPIDSESGDDTKLGLTLAGFRDLGGCYGLQAHVGNEWEVGPRAADDADSRLTYALALTKTLTDDCGHFSHFTVFGEFYAETILGGADDGETEVSFVSGARWEVGREWWVLTGVELPLSDPEPYDYQFRLGVVKEI